MQCNIIEPVLLEDLAHRHRLTTLSSQQLMLHPTASFLNRNMRYMACKTTVVLSSYHLLILCFNVLGTNRGPTDRTQHIKAPNDMLGGHNRFSK